MSLKSLLFTAAIPSVLLANVTTATAQTPCPNEITTAETREVRTSTENAGDACDVTIAEGGSVETSAGSAVVLDSDNNLTVAGTVSSSDADDTTGIEIQGGNTGEVDINGEINLSETTAATDTDGDNTIDGPFAEGTGRTGILISGASQFTGEIRANQGTVLVQGNDSYGFRLLSSAGLAGNLTLGGNIQALGSNAIAVSVEGDVTGDVVNNGTISATGEDAGGISVTGDINGQLLNGGGVTVTGYRFPNRPTVVNAASFLDETDTLQASSAIAVSGNITNGVWLQRNSVTDEDDVTTVTGNSTVNQFGSAPAILFDGNGTSISIGLVVPVTDANNTHLQYAFVNQGSISASGVLDDANSTAIAAYDVSFANGLNNSGNLTAISYRSGDDGTADLAGQTGIARVVVLGDGAIADTIQNSGLIVASVQENTTEIYSDLDNPLAARNLTAVAIDLEANANLTSIVNSGSISAALSGREGTAVAIRDASGTITIIDNTGNISAIGNNSDPLLTAETNFTTIALDLAANTTGVTITQSRESEDVAAPLILGDILLGAGDDSVDSTAGTITGDLAFAGGADTLTLANTIYTGTLTDTDGNLVITLTDGAALNQTTATPINATSASFDETSVFSPTIDGASGLASTLTTTGDISFASGASIAPSLVSIVDPANNSFAIADAGGSLNVGDLGGILSFDSPFLYDTSFAVDPNDPNALLITFDLRSTDALGFDPVQTAAFGPAFEALSASPALAESFLGITDGEQFRGAYNQLLPEFAAAARHFVVANVDGSVGAVGSHLENARKSQERPGGAWIQEFTYFADRDLAGLSEQFRGFGFGFTGGFDTSFGPFHTAGLNIGFASTEIEDVLGVDEPLDLMTFQTGLYGGIETGNLGIDIYGGAGFNDFGQNRRVTVGNFDETANGDWSGTHVNGSIRGGYDISLGKKYWLRPAFSVDYLRLSEKAYTETGSDAIALDVGKRTSELGGATAMMNLGANFEGRRTWIRPSLRFGYRNEFINDGVVTNYGFVGGTQRADLISQVFPEDGFLLGFSVAAGSNYSSVGLDFDSDIRDGFIRHTGRLVLRMIF